MEGVPTSPSLHPVGNPLTGLTVKVTVAECDKLPLVPVIVKVYVPVGVVLAVEMLSVEEPEPPIEAGLKLAEAPLGNPLTPRLTVAVKPLSALTLAVKLVPAPTVTDCELGVAEIEKSGTLTVKDTVVECDKLPLAPVRVRV